MSDRKMMSILIEKRLLGGSLDLNEFECLADDDLGGVAGVFLDFSVATHDRVTIKKMPMHLRERINPYTRLLTSVVNALLQDTKRVSH